MEQPQSTKRRILLEVFLGVLGAEEIQWTDETSDAISGTVIYDTTDIEERQDFIWHMTEDNVPSAQLIDLLSNLTENGLIEGDKLIIPTDEIIIPGMDNQTKEKLFDELFELSVDMLDDGQETDLYFIHT